MRYLLTIIPAVLVLLTSCNEIKQEIKKETKEEVREEVNHLKPKALDFGPGADG
jgi:hypothetical protein